MSTLIDDVSRIEQALACIPADLKRDDWARIGAALKNELGDAGFDLFDSWSQQGESYNAAAVRSTWRSLSASGGVTINTLFFKAIEHGFDSRGGVSTVDPAEFERRRAERDRRTAKEAEEREKSASHAATLALAVWSAASPAGADHPYLTRKGVQPVDTLREIDAGKLAALIGYQPKRGDDPLAGRILIAPVKVGGKLSTLEMIDGDGRKSALAGGVKAGGYWAAHKLPDAPNVVLIAEGVATALSASQCTGYPSIASLSVGQMEAAATVMRERYPDASLVMLADLDKVSGEPHETAVTAAQALGARLAVPAFEGDRQPDQTDFNDMHAARGAKAVKAAIDAVLALPKVNAAPVSTAEPDASADDAQPETDDQAIERLASLKPMEYDRVRKTEAARLKVRPATLDLMVREARGEGGSEEVALFDEVEPWHEPVDGAGMLSEIARAIRRFIVCDPETVTATALWCVTAWLVDHVSTCPILLINAPEKACGKTQLLTVTGELVPRPAQAAGISSSVLFRMIEKYKPTLLVDEIETVLTKEAEDLRGILNAGHTRPSAYIWRSVAVGDDFEPKRFSVFGFKALAGINADRLAETITSRSVVAALRRKLPHETVERLRHAEAGLFDRLKAKIARWTEDNADAIRTARPELPDELGDRDQDNWEPLLAVADLAGGTWPAWSRKAALKLCSHGEQSAQSTGAELLADIQEVFESKKLQRISMVDLLHALLADEERPWATWRGGRPMTPRSLGKILGEYGIKSKAVRIGYESPKGFEVDQFADAFARYLSSSPVPPLPSVTRSQPNTGAGLSVTEAQSRDQSKNPSVTLEPLSDKACDRVTEEKGETREIKKSVTDDEAEDEL